MSIGKKLLLGGVLCVGLLHADELGIDMLLSDIERKTDLSEKTKLENSGISYIYTREDIIRMQAHNLKDLLKSTYPFGYNENNYGISDPYSLQTVIPYMSSNLKIYIDNQEICTGLYGSGLIVYGNMDIDFVDHIEVYAGSPTYEFSTEPAFTIIKLYTKEASKDEGSKVRLGYGSYGTKSLTGYTTSTLDSDWSYFAYGNVIDDKRTTYYNRGSTLSRDSQTQHIMGTLTKENHHILLDMIQKKGDGFVDASLFATPKESRVDNRFFHFGYDTKVKNFSWLFTFDSFDSKSYFEDLNKRLLQRINAFADQKLIYKLESDSTSEVYTVGANYHHNTRYNKLSLGAKYRFKHFKYDTIRINDQECTRSGHDQQTTATLFVENQYALADNQIITMGVSFAQVRNNYSNQDDDLLSYRVGYTYTEEQFVSKTTISHIEFSIDPYLVNSGYLSEPTKHVKKSQQTNYIQNFKYTNGAEAYDVILSYMALRNQLLPDETGHLAVCSKGVDITSLLTRYTNSYGAYDKLELSIGVNTINNLPVLDVLTQYAMTLRNFTTLDNFEFFNEVIFYRDDYEEENRYDYSLGVLYHQSDDLTLSLKGTNLFDNAKVSEYLRISPETLVQERSLRISPIDRKLLLSIEYTF